MTILENKFNSKLFEFRRYIFSEATFLLRCTLGTAHKLRNEGEGGRWSLKFGKKRYVIFLNVTKRQLVGCSTLPCRMAAILATKDGKYRENGKLLSSPCFC